jgi:hypothetical protein
MAMSITYRWLCALVLAVLICCGPSAQADVVTEWNTFAANLTFVANVPTPPANRIMAIVQTAVYEAVNAITKRYPPLQADIQPAEGASIDVAVASANYTALKRLLPDQVAAIDSAYDSALSAIRDGKPKSDGIAIGERAAEAVLAMRENDGATGLESYRPATTAGVYVPTTLPLTPLWPQRKPWVMTSADQFRPAPPPALTSSTWARDYDEVKAVGSRNSAKRTAEQTGVAQFWEATGPIIYFPLVRSVADAPGRDITRNARLLAAAAQVMDDAIISVFDAKYHYEFWRPITAIRNGDGDDNDRTERDSTWQPFIPTPMHPEYPCAHCIVASAVAELLRAEVGAEPMPTLSATSPTAPGIVHKWSTFEDFVREVSEARIYDGVHYRNSTEVGNAMGRQIGRLAAAAHMMSSK